MFTRLYKALELSSKPSGETIVGLEIQKGISLFNHLYIDKIQK